MKFSIRDVLWLTVVVALAVGWGLDRRAAAVREAKLQEQQKATELKLVLEAERLQYTQAIQAAMRASADSSQK